MDSLQAFVGIDVSKGRIDVYVHPTGKKLCLKTKDDPCFGKLFDLLGETERSGYTIERIVLEATGGYEAACAAALSDGGFPVVVANPRQVRAFANATGRLAKTDRLDARAIAQFADKIRPQLRPLPDKSERWLREMITRRTQLVRMRTAESNRLENKQEGGAAHQSVERHLAFLDKEIELVEQEIEAFTSSNLAHQERTKLLKTAKGVGEVTAQTLATYLPELGKLSRKEIAAVAGLAPWSNESGIREGKRSIWGGRAIVRTTLYMATLSAIIHNPPIREMYQRLLSAGKKKKVALIACARKLLLILNSMVRTQTPFEAEKNTRAA